MGRTPWSAADAPVGLFEVGRVRPRSLPQTDPTTQPSALLFSLTAEKLIADCFFSSLFWRRTGSVLLGRLRA